MRRKLIFFDIDGTLITEGQVQRIPESTLMALELMKKKGHISVINTGRTTAAFNELIKSIPVDGYVCGCGTSVIMNGQVLFSHELDQAFCYKILCELDACQLEWLMEGVDLLYIADKDHVTGVAREVASLKKNKNYNFRILTPETYKDAQFVKFIMFPKEGSDLKRFMETFKDELTFIDRGHGMYEVIPKNYSKATGMKYLEEYFGIAHEDTFAVGDSTNDISMLEYAGIGILMGAAPEALHVYADYVTADIEKDGIYNACMHYGLI